MDVVVPGWSDDDDSAHRLGEFTRDMGNVEKIELLPYHELGKHKWVAMGEEYKLDGVKHRASSLIHDLVSVLFQNTFHALHRLFLRRLNAIKLIFFTHRHPFMFTQLMVGQKLNFLDVAPGTIRTQGHVLNKRPGENRAFLYFI